MQDVCEAICDARAWERALGDLEEYFGGWEPLASPLDDSSFDEHVAELVAGTRIFPSEIAHHRIMSMAGMAACGYIGWIHHSHGARLPGTIHRRPRDILTVLTPSSVAGHQESKWAP